MLYSRLKRLVPHFNLDPDHIDQRLRARLTLGEFAGFVLGISLTIGFYIVDNGRGESGIDLRTLIATYHGDFHGYFYPNWFLPIFAALSYLPFLAAYLISNFVNLLGIWFACRVFNGKAAIALLTYQTLYSVWYGQVVGILAGALALIYWAMLHRRYWLAGLALTIALIKPQSAIPLALAIWVTDNGALTQKLRVTILPIVVFGVSLIVYPLWPLDLLHRLSITPPDTNGSVVLWQWIGPLSLVLWLPVIFVPLSQGRRFVAVAAATALAIPYFQQSDLLLLFMLPVGGVGLLGNLGYLMGLFSWQALHALFVIPVLVYCWTFIDHFRKHAPASSPAAPAVTEIDLTA